LVSAPLVFIWPAIFSSLYKPFGTGVRNKGASDKYRRKID